MKILQLITNRDRRGAQVFAAQLADELADLGHEVRLVSLYAKENSSAEVHAKKAENIELSGKKKSLSFSILRKLRAQVTEFLPDVIQANGSDTLKYTVLATLGLKRKPILIYRNISMAGSWVNGRIQKMLYNYFFKRIDHVVSLTQTTRNEFVTIYRYPENKISIIPIGVNVPVAVDRIKSREALARLAGFPLSAKVLLHVGSFTQEKNHPGLLRIFKQAREKVPSVTLVLAGDGLTKSGIQNKVIEMGLADVVCFVGSRDDVADWMGGTDALLLPSLVEGLPGVILEAMAYQVPVIAYDVGAIGEIIENGKNGYVVARQEENLFAQKIVELLESESSRSGFALEGYRRVQNEYSLSRISKRFEDIYTLLLKQARS